MNLSTVSEGLLIEELARRARNRAPTKPDDVPYCEECTHFRYFTGDKYMPKNYNPCGLKHLMEFQAPVDDSAVLSGDFGFFRAVCEDRGARQ